jgi:hypothetical protein
MTVLNTRSEMPGPASRSKNPGSSLCGQPQRALIHRDQVAVGWVKTCDRPSGTQKRSRCRLA